MGKVTRYSRCFSTHILTRRMTNLSMDLLKRMYIFNSHPHKEDDDTHKRAISCREFFNSHPHKEDDWNIPPLQISGAFFNSHPHMEDDGAGNGLPFTIMFSTHILTRRMTLASSRLTTLFAFFNSHPHKEDDNVAFSNVAMTTHFQLTSSQGG